MFNVVVVAQEGQGIVAGLGGGAGSRNYWWGCTKMQEQLLFWARELQGCYFVSLVEWLLVMMEQEGVAARLGWRSMQS